MSKVGRWSTAAGSNNATPPNGWPEGQLPSTVNDCAREMMASIRTALLDPQFIDQDMTPTYITAASFSVPGNQTSAIQIGRRLKMFDATAGVQQIVYATVLSVSFTAVTTVQIEADSGSLTSSLSSFGISIISNTNNALPRQSDLTVSTIAVTGGLSISGVAAMNGPVAMGSTLSVSGAAVFNTTLSISATCGAAAFVGGSFAGPNVVKAFVAFTYSGTSPVVFGSLNVTSISHSATGIVRINLSSSIADANLIVIPSLGGIAFLANLSYVSATVVKMTTMNAASVNIDASAHMLFLHA